MRKVNDLSTLDKEGWKKEEIDGGMWKTSQFYIFLFWKENRKTKCCQTLYSQVFCVSQITIGVVSVNYFHRNCLSGVQSSMYTALCMQNYFFERKTWEKKASIISSLGQHHRATFVWKSDNSSTATMEILHFRGPAWLTSSLALC